MAEIWPVLAIRQGQVGLGVNPGIREQSADGASRPMRVFGSWVTLEAYFDISWGLVEKEVSQH